MIFRLNRPRLLSGNNMEPDLQLEHRIKMAHDFELHGKFLHAAQIYNAIINQNPSCMEVYFSIANLYEHMGNINPALDLIENYLNNYSDNRELRLFLGQYLLRNARWEKAIETLSLITPEEEPVAAFFLGYSHFMLEEYEEAKINFMNFISVERKNELVHEANIYLAKIEIKLKNYNKALSFAKKADGVYSNFWELNQIYAETYYNLGMFAHAVTPIEKAIKLNPDESLPYEWAGKIYFKLGDYVKAEKNFLKYIESIEDASSDIYAKLAEACLKSKKTKDAFAYYSIAVKLDPHNKLAVEGKSKAALILKNKTVSDG
jgi:tetratricopeptide (TPR) repeat protein